MKIKDVLEGGAILEEACAVKLTCAGVAADRMVVAADGDDGDVAKRAI